jgi:hypothetical protein
MGQRHPRQTKFLILDEEGNLILESEGILISKEKTSIQNSNQVPYQEEKPSKRGCLMGDKFSPEHPSLPLFSKKYILNEDAMLCM